MAHHEGEAVKPQPYAYMCTTCGHLASRHYMASDAPTVEGPYLCSHCDCVCTTHQADPMVGINKAEFNVRFAATLDQYEEPTTRKKP